MELRITLNWGNDLNIETVSWPDQPDWPRVKSVQRLGSRQIQLALLVRRDTSWFEGHFPAHPVLPGVVQVHWACRIVSRVWEQLQDCREIKNLKFQKLVLPGDELQLELEHDQSMQQVSFKFSQKTEVCSQGRLCFTRGHSI